MPARGASPCLCLCPCPFPCLCPCPCPCLCLCPCHTLFACCTRICTSKWQIHVLQMLPQQQQREEPQQQQQQQCREKPQEGAAIATAVRPLVSQFRTVSPSRMQEQKETRTRLCLSAQRLCVLLTFRFQCVKLLQQQRRRRQLQQIALSASGSAERQTLINLQIAAQATDTTRT